MSTMHDINISQALLVVAATEGIFGTPGKVLLAIMVLFACLTTSIGLTSSAGTYFPIYNRLEDYLTKKQLQLYVYLVPLFLLLV